MRRDRRAPRRSKVRILSGRLPKLALLAAALVPILGQAGRFPITHEEYRYPALVELYARGLVADGFPVRWLPDLATGYGYPTFLYYPQGLFALATGWKLALGLTDVVALGIAVWTCLATGAFGMFSVGRRLSGSDAGGWMSALMFLFSPWLAVDLVVRGDLQKGRRSRSVRWRSRPHCRWPAKQKAFRTRSVACWAQWRSRCPSSFIR